jgi:hypothetical protein
MLVNILMARTMWKDDDVEGSKEGLERKADD